tara:strand:- start:1422 stop:2720 length:1299 start_codon:yes stop_codon:yes gene_type:complete
MNGDTKDSEGNKTTTRLKRYASVTSAVSGSVARAATGKMLGREVDHSLQAKAITKALGRLKGPVMKIAQMLSTIPDAVPAEYALEFQSLQADAPAMGWPFVRRRMAVELGADWYSKFQSFDQSATSAASLGQVHKATSLEGEPLACKLQYPDMTSTVQADLNQLKLALKIYEATLGGIKTASVFEEISQRLAEELDYDQEAKNLDTFRDIFKSHPTIHVPKVYSDLSTNRLLTMSWLEGTPLRDILETSQDYRNRMAELAFKAWYYPLFHHQIIHGDPHLGNYSFRQESRHGDEGINLFDFGCVRRFDKPFLQGVKDLYHALDQGDKALEVHAYETLGFKDLSKEMLEVLRLWATLLYEPVLDDRVRPMQKGHSGIYGRDMADKVHQELKKLGGVAPPREFVFMDRAAVGVGSLCLHLKAEANWYQLYNELM